MSHTITAIYRTKETADIVRRKIEELGTPGRHIHVVGGAGRENEIDTLHLPDEETTTYKQAVRQGHHVVSADVEDSMIDAVADLMRHPEQGVDIDAYETDYRASSDYTAAAMPGVAAVPGAMEGTATAEETIRVAEERLTVGTRATGHGSAHVRTYVQEVPVEERVRLREERLSVERRPVDEVVSGAEADALFKDRDIEVTTRSEEAVIGKETVVTEEVVVGKEVSEREEVVRDTVRKTEVDVDRDGDAKRDDV